MVVLTEYIPQQEQAVFTSKPLAEVKEISNLGKVQLPEQEARVVIKVTLALKESKNLVVLAVQQPKHPPVSPHLPPEEVGYIAPMVPPEGTHTVADNPLLESARASTKAALEQLVKEGYITGFEEWGCLDEEDDLEEGDALYFVAYAKAPRSVERRLAELSSRLTRAHRVPIFIVTFKKDA
jgi:hypothetical protein